MKAWIIEEIKKEAKQDEVRLRLPLESVVPSDVEEVKSEDERGIVTIDIWDEEED